MRVYSLTWARPHVARYLLRRVPRAVRPSPRRRGVVAGAAVGGHARAAGHGADGADGPIGPLAVHWDILAEEINKVPPHTMLRFYLSL